jgi:hypothetical protein
MTPACATAACGFLGSQGGHDGAIAVSPFDANIIVAGGQGPWWSLDGGGTPPQPFQCSALGICPGDWFSPRGQPPKDQVHEDIHAIAFADATHVFMATDGGVMMSTGLVPPSTGQSWTTQFNTLPAMQERGVSVNNSGPTSIILASAWDVGIHWSLNGGSTWAGDNNDSVAVHIDSALPASEWYSVPFGSNFSIQESPNEGQAWNGPVPPDSFPIMSNFQNLMVDLNQPTAVNPNAVFGAGTLNWPGVWELDNGSGPASFQKYGNSFANAPNTVSAFVSAGQSFVLAGAFQGGDSSTQNLKITNSGGSLWTEIGESLPTSSTPGSVGNSTNGSKCTSQGCPVCSVAQCPSGQIVALKRDSFQKNMYVLTSSGRVFADSNADLAASAIAGSQPQWIELTGNLPPNVRYNDIVIDSARGTIFVASVEGAFKAVNSCLGTVLADRTLRCWPTHWQTWGDGFSLVPAQVNQYFSGATSSAGGSPALDVEGLDAQQPPPGVGGSFWIYAATWERGIWARDATAGDP